MGIFHCEVRNRKEQIIKNTLSPHIEQIPLALTLQIRHTAMYPDENPDAVELPDDEDGFHFGLFDHNTLISVVSWFRRNEAEAQFRKLATLEEFRNSGYATLLMKYVIDFSESENIRTLWANARVNALSFYKKLGFKETSEIFRKRNIEYVIIQLGLN
jgi:GNAT superfamily N-acetyltransferase